MQEFNKQFEGIDKESGVVLLSALFLMCIFPYQGHPEYFAKNFYVMFGSDLDYWSQIYRFFFTFGIFFLIPVLITIFVIKKPLKEYGFGLGDYKFGFKFVLFSMILLPLPMYFNASNPEFLNEYPLWKSFGDSNQNILQWTFLYLFYYIGWEFFFRGYMQFNLLNKLPAFYIIMIQTIPSTIIHIGKPQGETISAIVGGVIFGAVALRTRSILYPLLIHWYLGILNEYFCYLHLGN